MNLYQALKNFTSDHAWQTIRVKDQDPSGNTTEVRGFTWNLLNKGFKKDEKRGPNSYSNNPFNIQEGDSDYRLRKAIQLVEIIDFIKSRENSEPLDFMFLQEVNLFDYEFINDEHLKTIVDDFKGNLSALNWELKLMPGAANAKAMVTLYNKKTLELNSQIPPRGVFSDNNNRQQTGFELNFTHKITKKPIALTNVHLDYNKDHTDDIIKYQFDKINNNVMCVIGGDCNHTPNLGIHGMVGNYHYPTCIALDHQNQGKITDIDTRENKNYKMHYDGFFCSPGGTKNLISAEENISSYFVVKNGELDSLQVYDPRKKPHHLHKAKQGMPWYANGDEALYARYQRKPVSQNPAKSGSALSNGTSTSVSKTNPTSFPSTQPNAMTSSSAKLKSESNSKLILLGATVGLLLTASIAIYFGLISVYALIAIVPGLAVSSIALYGLDKTPKMRNTSKIPVTSVPANQQDPSWKSYVEANKLPPIYNTLPQFSELKPKLEKHLENEEMKAKTKPKPTFRAP